MKAEQLHVLFAAIDEVNECCELSDSDWVEINAVLLELLPNTQRTAYNLGTLIGFWIAHSTVAPSSMTKGENP